MWCCLLNIVGFTGNWTPPAGASVRGGRLKNGGQWDSISYYLAAVTFNQLNFRELPIHVINFFRVHFVSLRPTTMILPFISLPLLVCSCYNFALLGSHLWRLWFVGSHYASLYTIVPKTEILRTGDGKSPAWGLGESWQLEDSQSRDPGPPRQLRRVWLEAWLPAKITVDLTIRFVPWLCRIRLRKHHAQQTSPNVHSFIACCLPLVSVCVICVVMC
jgi:hypothetical protein